MGVKLRENIKSSGVKSLYLDINSNGKRFKEYLRLNLIPSKTIEGRERNKEIKLLAESIRAKRELELQASEYDYTPKFKNNIDFLAFYKKFLDEYSNKDIRIVKYSYEWFKKYLELNNIKIIKPKQVTTELCKKYLEYMQNNLNGETPYNYFTKFKKVVSSAIDKNLILKNPVKEIRVTRDEGLKKEILSQSEIQILANAYCGNNEVKKAFLLCLNTGIRWCDVKELKFKNIDYSNKTITFTQQKTKHSSKKSTITIHINQTVTKMIGDKRDNELNVFTLPSHTGCLKSLREWVKKAGITKHITWHCSRHSFAVNMLDTDVVGADVKTVSGIMGHSSIKHTDKYLHYLDKKGKESINKLPEIEFNN